MVYIQLFQTKLYLQQQVLNSCHSSLFPESIHPPLSSDLPPGSVDFSLFAVQCLFPSGRAPCCQKRYLNIHFHSPGQRDVNQLQPKVMRCLVKRCVSAHRHQPGKGTHCTCQPGQQLRSALNGRGKSKQLVDISV